MRHRKAGLKLNRTSSHREAMFKNMVTSLFKYDRIRTTDVKAKELRRWADNLVTLAKRGDLHARRQALSIIREKPVVHKLFAEASERFGDIVGGYTRVVKLGRRPGDAAPISLIELVAIQKETGKKKKKEKKEERAKKTAQEKTAVLEASPDPRQTIAEEKTSPDKAVEETAKTEAAE
jgi:large subunit ribosomal protein L17